MENLLDEFKTVGARLAEKGFVSGSGGNLSVRLNDEIVITRHGASLGRLKAGDLVKVELGATSGEASVDLPIHNAIYESGDFKAVVHAHPPYAVVCSFLFNVVEPIDVEGKYLLGRIPVVRGPVGSRELAEKVGVAVTGSKAVIVYGHGTYVAGSSLEEAYEITCAVEHACKILYLKLLMR